MGVCYCKPGGRAGKPDCRLQQDPPGHRHRRCLFQKPAAKREVGIARDKCIEEPCDLFGAMLPVGAKVTIKRAWLSRAKQMPVCKAAPCPRFTGWRTTATLDRNAMSPVASDEPSSTTTTWCPVRPRSPRTRAIVRSSLKAGTTTHVSSPGVLRHLVTR